MATLAQLGKISESFSCVDVLDLESPGLVEIVKAAIREDERGAAFRLDFERPLELLWLTTARKLHVSSLSSAVLTVEPFGPGRIEVFDPNHLPALLEEISRALDAVREHLAKNPSVFGETARAESVRASRARERRERAAELARRAEEGERAKLAAAARLAEERDEKFVAAVDRVASKLAESLRATPIQVHVAPAQVKVEPKLTAVLEAPREKRVDVVEGPDGQIKGLKIRSVL